VTQAVTSPSEKSTLEEESFAPHKGGHAAFQIIPSRTSDPDQTEEALQAAMQGLVLDKQRPIALEITSRGANGAKQFLIRATDQGALEHAKAHIRAYAPQVAIRSPGCDDPFVLSPGETVSAYELRPGAAAYLPMRDMKETDPIRGLLASLTLPPDMRAVAQIVLIPATPAWSRNNLRQSVEHPLEKERQRRRDALQSSSRSSTPSTAGLLFLFIVLALLLLYRRFSHVLPAWLLQTCVDLFFSGQPPQLPLTEMLLFYGGLATLFIVPILLTIGLSLIKKRFLSSPVYDQRQVARKTGQMAYQACLRLYVFGPGPSRSLMRILWRYGRFQWQATGRNRLKLLWRGKRHWKEEKDWRIAQQKRRMEVLDRLVAAYRQFDTASAGYFVPKPTSDARACQLVEKGQWAKKMTSSRHYITADFLSRAWYLPKDSLFELPGIEQKRSRTLLIPASLIASPQTRIIGFSRHAGYAFPFALPSAFLQQHTLIGGKTGEGKSTLMVHIACEAIATGALCVIDPHGDLAHDILRSIPQQRWDDIVFLDLGDTVYSVGINPLDVTLRGDRDLIVAALVETFKHIWESGWGTRMEAPFRSAIMTLVEANEHLVQQGEAHQQYTLLDVMHLLLDESFCHDILANVQDMYLHRFWYLYYQTLDGRQQRERIDPIITKMLQFESRVARRILGQGRSTINLNELVREQKILVIRLSASEAGLAAPILGATFLSLLMVALREQSVLAPEERTRMSIIVDEFQTLPGADYAQLLAELRKFGGAAVLATQSFDYLTKLNPHLRATTMANVKQYFMFRLSADDARLIARELLDVTEADILNLDLYTCYVKLIDDQKQQPTFSLHIERPQLHERDSIELIRARSRRLSRLAADVDQELLIGLTRALQAQPSPQEESKKKRATRSQKGDAMNSAVESTPMHQKAQSSETHIPPSGKLTAQPPKTIFANKGSRHTRFVSPRKKPQASPDGDLITSFNIHSEQHEEASGADL
jgi:hypothetical protein